jgi:hypothetical protein
MDEKSRDESNEADDSTTAQTGMHMSTLTLAMPAERIALFKAIIESYDNLATLRTEDPRLHHLRLFFAPAQTAEVEALLDSLSERFEIRRLAST